jgi:hypothetical protein
MLLALLFLALIPLASGQPGSPKSSLGPALCKLETIPSDIKNRLTKEFGSWKIQEAADLGPLAADLGPLAQKRWASEKPLACPGIAVGSFDEATTPSCVLLLVPRSLSGSAYKLLVFSRKAGHSNYDLRIVEQSGGIAASNLFIHGIRIADLFNNQSRKKFNATMEEGILFVDSAENEYEADVFFWANGRYQREPVDY